MRAPFSFGRSAPQNEAIGWRAQIIERFELCAECGLPIGVYERFVWRMPDRSMIDGRAVARGTDAEAEPAVRGELLHSACA